MSAGALLGLVLAAELSTRNGRELPRNHLFPQRRHRINEHHSLEVGELMLHYPGQETVGPFFVLGEIFIHITHFHTFGARDLLVDTGNAQAALFHRNLVFARFKDVRVDIGFLKVLVLRVIVGQFRMGDD